MKRDLIQRINELGPDGQELIELMVERIERATPEYGPLKIKDDADYFAEAMEEMIDAPLWMGMEAIRRKRIKHTEVLEEFVAAAKWGQ